MTSAGRRCPLPNPSAAGNPHVSLGGSLMELPQEARRGTLYLLAHQEPLHRKRAHPEEPSVPDIRHHAHRAHVAYLTIKIGLKAEMHTYSGGLGILAGDIARSAADLRLPMVFVTLASREGYLRQGLDREGRQVDHVDPWEPSNWATPLGGAVTIVLEDRPVRIRPWLH